MVDEQNIEHNKTKKCFIETDVCIFNLEESNFFGIILIFYLSVINQYVL